MLSCQIISTLSAESGIDPWFPNKVQTDDIFLIRKVVFLDMITGLTG